MTKLKRWYLSAFKILTLQQAEAMGLTWKRNIYGDEINMANCRSIWQDGERTYRGG